jgi:hypothetical protein
MGMHFTPYRVTSPLPFPASPLPMHRLMYGFQFLNIVPVIRFSLVAAHGLSTWH